MSVNKVILVGNLGADPEVRSTPSGQTVANLRIATNEVWNDKDGNRQERTEWHTVSVWGRQAEHCGQYLAKGRQVYIEGRLQSRTYNDKEGVERRAWEVVATTVQFLGGRDGGGGGGAGGGAGGGWGGGQGGGGQGGGGQGGGGKGGWGGGQGGQGGGGKGGWGGGGQGGGGWGGGGPEGGEDDPIPF